MVRQEEQAQDQRKVFDLSKELEEATFNKLKEVAEELNRQLQQIGKNYRAVAETSKGKKYWFRRPILELARKNEYFADTRAYMTWVRLLITEEREVSLTVSFHGIGFKFLGLLAASSFILYRDRSENHESTVEGPYQACEEIFQFSYIENPEEVKKRFLEWLDKSVVMGLYHWRKQL